MGGKVSVWASRAGAYGRFAAGTVAAAVGTAEINGVLFKASGLNSGTIYVGFGSAVDDESGYPLEADETLALSIRQLSDVWAIASADDQYLHYLATEE